MRGLVGLVTGLVTGRVVAAGAAAAVAAALVGASATAARADDPAVPTPSPSALASVASGSPPAAPAAGVVDGFPIGLLAGRLVEPVLLGVREAGAAVVDADGGASVPVAPGDPAGTPSGNASGGSPGGPSGSAATPDAAGLQPGGGSSGDARPWTPKAPVRLPTVPVTPSGSTGVARPTTKEQILWAAYASAARSQTACRISPMLLAAIGEVESSSLRGRRLDARHDAVPAVRGPALRGGSFARITDSDGGRFDGDPVWDHAVGPMQFIPGTWRLWGADGNRDGVADPQNVEDAALAAARYLCAGGRDLSRRADLTAAVRSYNHSDRYVRTVLGILDAVSSGAVAGP